jgi:hypothetical protein
VAATVIALLAPAAAGAAQVRVAPGPSEVGGDLVFPGPDVLVFEAAPGENNVPTFTRSGMDLIVTDPGATLTAGDGCAVFTVGHGGAAQAPAEPHAVRCSPDTQPLRQLDLALGDGDDFVRLGVVDDLRNATIDGGAGTDVIDSGNVDSALSGGDGDDTLTSGTLTDHLDGGPGRDTLSAGNGFDVLVDADGDTPDALDGGPADDLVSFAGRTTPVSVDLAGSTGDGDELISIEHATGGDGDDTITGTAATNDLTGGEGDDDLRGLGGDDTLEGEGGTDTADCADGKDVVGDPDLAVPADCERVLLTYGRGRYDLPAHPLRVTRRSVTFRINCAIDPPMLPLGPHFAGCDGRLVLRAGGAKLGGGKIAGNHVHPFDKVNVALTRRGRKRLAGKPRAVEVRITGKKIPHASWIVAL